MGDLAALVDDEGRLDVNRWRALTIARRNNALRAWLLTCLERGAPETLIERLMVETARRQRRAMAGGPGTSTGLVPRPARLDCRNTTARHRATRASRP